MKTNIRLTVQLAAIAGLLGAVVYATPPRPEYKTLVLPGIFKTNTPNARIEAIRTAELDATRALVELVSGVNVASASIIGDYLVRKDEIAAAVQKSIVGVMSTGAPMYLEDGSLIIPRAVPVRVALQSISQALAQTENKEAQAQAKELAKHARTNSNELLEVHGSGALPGTVGMLRIQAKRAALLDAYRKLAEQLLGVELDSQTTVRRAVLDSDRLKSRVEFLVKGASEKRTVYFDDNSCEIEMELTMGQLFEVVRRYPKTWLNEQEVTKKEQEYRTRVLKVTGYGAAREDSNVPPNFPDEIAKGETVLETLLQEEPIAR